MISKSIQPDKFDFLKGEVILIDKPQGFTSFDVIRYLKKNLRGQFKKIGHAGTLDPMATGLLILCTGKETKNIHKYQDASKKYSGTLKLGASTPSLDKETEEDASCSIEQITPEKIHHAAKSFEGQITQIPPMYSALRHQGKRLYELARKGEEVKRKERTVEIFDFHITDINLPYVNFEVHCSKGTYIRTLAADLAEKMDNLAYLTALRRTAIGSYEAADALSPEELKNLVLEKMPANAPKD